MKSETEIREAVERLDIMCQFMKGDMQPEELVAARCCADALEWVLGMDSTFKEFLDGTNKQFDILKAAINAAKKSKQHGQEP